MRLGVSELGEGVILVSLRWAVLMEAREGWFVGHVSEGLGLGDMLLELSVIRLRVWGSWLLDSGKVGDIGQGNRVWCVWFIDILSSRASAEDVIDCGRRNILWRQRATGLYILVGDNKNRLQPSSVGGLNRGVKGGWSRSHQVCLLQIILKEFRIDVWFFGDFVCYQSL